MKNSHRFLQHITQKTPFLILMTLLILLCPAMVAAVESFSEDTVQATLEPEKTSFFFTLGPVGMLNTDTQSAPSPIQFTCGFGTSIPVNSWFLVAPSLSAFTTYYLWRDDASGGRSYPAEVENRTALAPSALIELPAVFYARTAKSTFSLGLGASFFARYAFLADSVPQSEAGDVKKINSFFYSGLRFLYPSAFLAYDYTTENGMKAGVALHVWLPLASLLEDRGLDGGMASAVFRITLANKSHKAENTEESE